MTIEAGKSKKKGTGRSRNGGTGRKKIEIKEIQKSVSKSVTFSKRKKSLFAKARHLEEKTGATVAILAFSPGGKPFFQGDIESALKALQEAPSTSNTPEDDVTGASMAVPTAVFNGGTGEI